MTTVMGSRIHQLCACQHLYDIAVEPTGAVDIQQSGIPVDRLDYGLSHVSGMTRASRDTRCAGEMEVESRCDCVSDGDDEAWCGASRSGLYPFLAVPAFPCGKVSTTTTVNVLSTPRQDLTLVVQHVCYTENCRALALWYIFYALKLLH